MAMALLVKAPPVSSQNAPMGGPFYCLKTDENGKPVNNSQRICFPLSSIDTIFPDGPTPTVWMRSGGALGFANAEWDRLTDYARANGMPYFPDRPGRVERQKE
jgi:hypothetical protein